MANLRSGCINLVDLIADVDSINEVGARGIEIIVPEIGPTFKHLVLPKCGQNRTSFNPESLDFRCAIAMASENEKCNDLRVGLRGDERRRNNCGKERDDQHDVVKEGRSIE